MTAEQFEDAVQSVMDASLAMTPAEKEQQRECLFVFRAIRNDQLGDMHANNLLGDSQFMAGRRWQAEFEKDSIVTTRRVGKALGKVGASVVHDILACGFSVAEVAAKRDGCSPKAIAGWHAIFIRCLNVLADEFGRSNVRVAIS